jgi:hypothetical protein
MPREHGPVAELLKGIPRIVGIRLNEEPEYQTLETHGDIEIRCYERMTLAQVTLPGHYESFSRSASLILSDYLFGMNLESLILAMTTPVLFEKVKTANWEVVPFCDIGFAEDSTSEWMMSCILPSGYEVLNAPKPINPNIRLVDVPRTTYAVVSYSGNNTVNKMIEYSETLTSFLNQSLNYQRLSGPIVAQYDQDTTLSFFKKNEILIGVSSLQYQ